MVGVAVADRLDVFRTRRAHTATFSLTVGASAALAAVVTEAAPTGIPFVDKLYVAALTASVAYLAASARRWTWFLPAGAGAAMAADEVALACAAAAILLGVWSVWADQRTRTRAAMVTGLGVASLMRGDVDVFHGASALVAGAAILPVMISGYDLARRRVRRRIRKVVYILSGFVALIGAGLAVGLFLTAEDVYKGIDLLRDGVVAAQDADDDEVAVNLSQASRHLGSAADTFSSWFVQPARLLPVVGQNLKAVEQLSDDVGDVAQVSSLAASKADLDSLRFNEGRIDLEVIRQMIGPTEDVSKAVDQARDAVHDVESPWLVDYVKGPLDEVDVELRENLPDLENALGALQIANGLLGGEGDRRYLVLFTTPVEARGRSGFPGNYAELVASNGQVSMPRFGRIKELDDEGVPGDQRVLTAPPAGDPMAQPVQEYLSRYSRFGPATSWRNLTMSPDLPTIAAIAKQLYPQSGGPPIDGVMIVDPEGLAGLMNWTGPITTSDIPELTEDLTPETAANFLLHQQYVQFQDDNEDRVDFLEDVARLTFDRLTSQTQMPSPRLAVNILDPIVENGHIQFVTFDEAESNYFEHIGLSGKFLRFGQHPLSLVTTNAGGNKIDYYLQRSMRFDATWDPDSGAMTGKINVTLTNTATLDLPDYFVGNEADDEDVLPRGTNRSFVSVYTPLDVRSALLNGQPIDLQREVELNAAVYSTFVDIPAGGTVSLELDVSGTWAVPALWLAVPPQPMVHDDQLVLNVAVEGNRRLKVEGEGVTVDGRTASYNGPGDRTVVVSVTPK